MSFLHLYELIKLAESTNVRDYLIEKIDLFKVEETRRGRTYYKVKEFMESSSELQPYEINDTHIQNGLLEDFAFEKEKDGIVFRVSVQ